MTTQSGVFSTPAFIIKLYDILEDQNQNLYGHVIRWSEDGEYFIVLQPKLMESEILLHYFKHNHYQSFLRQLNMYEFIKARNSENYEIFSHPNFKRGEKKQLCQIKRNPVKTKNIKKDKRHKKNTFQVQVEEELTFLKQRQSRFDVQIQEICTQSNTLLDQHKQLWQELGNSRKIIDMKIDRISYLISFILQQQEPVKSDSSGNSGNGASNQIYSQDKLIQRNENNEELSPLIKMMKGQLRGDVKLPFQQAGLTFDLDYSPVMQNDSIDGYSDQSNRSNYQIDKEQQKQQ